MYLLREETMPTIAKSDILEVGIYGHQTNSGECDNVLHLMVDGTGTGPWADAEIVATVTSFLQTLWATIQNSEVGATFWDTYILRTAPPGSPGNPPNWRIVGQYALNLHGNDTSDPLPAGVSAVVTSVTGTRGRRGRTFLAALGELYSASQNWTVTGIARIAAYAAAWLLGVDGTQLEKLLPIVLKAGSTIYSMVVSARAGATPGYQRRRKPGVGN
jgi:hypothetical protein